MAYQAKLFKHHKRFIQEGILDQVGLEDVLTEEYESSDR
jgi:hypothetical protein